MSGLLQIVATPIGNLEDVTLRSLRTLREADRILAEDTRHTRKLCQHHGIETRLTSLHAHTKDAKIVQLVETLRGGATLALVSDAGTPLVSDPGAALVEAAVSAGIRVETIPGPSAVTAALTVSGLPCETFRFIGFLPRSGGRRTAILDEIARERGATVLFEAPGRVARTLTQLAERLGERRVAVCRELTKVHEEVIRGAPASVAERIGTKVRGEVTIVVEGTGRSAARGEALSDEEIDARIVEGLADGLGPSDLARSIADASALSRSEAYRRVLAKREPPDDP